ncbi:MAG: hypothetical protein R3B72_49400, partial [Polyangiaceae bacterium]
LPPRPAPSVSGLAHAFPPLPSETLPTMIVDLHPSPHPLRPLAAFLAHWNTDALDRIEICPLELDGRPGPALTSRAPDAITPPAAVARQLLTACEAYAALFVEPPAFVVVAHAEGGAFTGQLVVRLDHGHAEGAPAAAAHLERLGQAFDEALDEEIRAAVRAFDAFEAFEAAEGRRLQAERRYLAAARRGKRVPWPAPRSRRRPVAARAEEGVVP